MYPDDRQSGKLAKSRGHAVNNENKFRYVEPRRSCGPLFWYMNSITAFAPASVGNVGAGFDVLGHALDSIGDQVTLTVIESREILVGSVGGTVGELPRDPELNTATRPLIAMSNDFGIDQGLQVDILKGVPLGSGMGGSAASAVAAVIAADQLWHLDLDLMQLLSYALVGEEVASGAKHPDNVAPSLIGGLVMCEQGGNQIHVTRLPVPRDLRCVLVHPEIVINTHEARALLSKEVALADYVLQSQYLAGFVAGCCLGDTEQIGRCLKDILVEPQRSALIPAFDAVRAAALEEGALGMSISGSGPSVFAWCRQAVAERVADCMSTVFAKARIEAQSWISEIDTPGARIVSQSSAPAGTGKGNC
jgi:homoserine kinase